MPANDLDNLKAQMLPTPVTFSPCAERGQDYIARMIAPISKYGPKHDAAVMAGKVESHPERRRRGYNASFELPLETQFEWELSKTIRAAVQRGATVGAVALFAAAAAQTGTHPEVSRKLAYRLLAASQRTELKGRSLLPHLSEDGDLRKNLRVFAGVQHLWAAWYTMIQEDLGRADVYGLLPVRRRIAVYGEQRPGSSRELARVALELEDCDVLERFEALAAFYNDALDQRGKTPWFDLGRVAQGRVSPDWIYCQGIVASVRASLA